MKNQLKGVAPDARRVAEFVLSQIWRAKWVVAISGLLTIALVFLLFGPAPRPVWSGRTTIHIGLAPAIDYIMQRSGPALVPVETRHDVVARISDPAFRSALIGRTKFDPLTADFSRDMSLSSLRAVILPGERLIAIEATAGSRADVEAVIRNVADEIIRAHSAIIHRRIQQLRIAIHDTANRIALIENVGIKFEQALAYPGFNSVVRLNRPELKATVELWSRLKEEILHDKNLIAFSEPTTASIGPNEYPIEERSIGPLKASIIAGLLMLIAVMVLVILVSPARQA